MTTAIAQKQKVTSFGFPKSADKEALGELTKGGIFITDEQLARFFPSDPSRARQEMRLALIDMRDRKPFSGPTEKPSEVRIAVKEDEDAIVDLLVLDLMENAVHVAPINEEKVRKIVQLGTERKGGIIGVIDGPIGKPVAVTIYRYEDWWWSNAFYLVKMVDFVHPDHRRSNHAAKLIKFGAWASDFMTKQFGYRVYEMAGVLATKCVNEKVRLYRKHSNYVGAFFLYPMPPTLER